VLFHQEATAAVGVWIASTAFSHCFVVLPIAGYLAWDRRRLAAHPVQPVYWVALAGVPLAFAWFVAERAGLMEGRQLVAVCFVELLFLAVLGWRLWAVFSPALLYLFFLVPFGAFLVPDLQVFTTRFITAGLAVLGIPYYADAMTIQIPSGTFFVAEACAGLRFLIASVAFGVLFALLFYRSWIRRAAFIGASVVVPVIANGFRGLGIVVLGHLLGSPEAAAVDHIVYGWLFFSAVLLMMILGGLPFRQDGAPQAGAPQPAMPAPASGESSGQALWGALAVVVVMAAGPALSFALDKGAAAQGFANEAAVFAPGPDCVASPGPDHAAVRRFACHGIEVTAAVEVFPAKTKPSILLAARNATSAEVSEETRESEVVLAPDSPCRWQVVETTGSPLTATSLWINGHPSAGNLASRVRQGWNSIVGTDHAPVLLSVVVGRPDGDSVQVAPDQLRLTLTSFLQAQRGLETQIASLSAQTAALPNKK
jgi:exosortase A